MAGVFFVFLSLGLKKTQDSQVCVNKTPSLFKCVEIFDSIANAFDVSRSYTFITQDSSIMFDFGGQHWSNKYLVTCSSPNDIDLGHMSCVMNKPCLQR